ncbi:hypothetical protein, partial [Enterobacter hormaechei]|uniref:hypothetical protein n=1 Tax=Enterobacter hormaechei TaxID=158836 RepID=UPI00203BAC09
ALDQPLPIHAIAEALHHHRGFGHQRLAAGQGVAQRTRLPGLFLVLGARCGFGGFAVGVGHAQAHDRFTAAQLHFLALGTAYIAIV